MIKKQAFGLMAHDENANSLAFVDYVPRGAWIECVREARSRSLDVESSDGLETRPHCRNSKFCEQ
jgi:hypothetical protein